MFDAFETWMREIFKWPLHSAIQNFYRDIRHIERLLNHGIIDINVRNLDGETPLHLAIKNEHCTDSLIRLLLKHGADPKARNSEGCIPLHYAVQKKTLNQDQVELLLEYDDYLRIRNFNGDTPLHLYLQNQSSLFHKIKWFLEKSVNVNVVNVKGETPLHVFVRNKGCRRNDAILCLIAFLSHGADLSIKDALGENVYQAYCRTEDEANRTADPTVQMLLQANEHMNSSLQVACLFHNVDSVHRLLKLGTDVNAIDTFGYSPLFYAFFASGDNDKRLQTLRLLFEFSADINHPIYNVAHVVLHYFNPYGNMQPITIFLGLESDSYCGCPETLNIIVEYLAKLTMLREKRIERGIDVEELMDDLHNGDYLTVFGIHVTRTKLKEYYKECLSRCSEEVKLMNEAEIGESGVSFLDLLLADVKETAVYAKNKELIKAFNDKKAMFPMYQEMLDAKLARDLERRKLVESAAVSLSDALMGLVDPRHEFFERTFSFCSNEDLMNVIDGLDEIEHIQSSSFSRGMEPTEELDAIDETSLTAEDKSSNPFQRVLQHAKEYFRFQRLETVLRGRRYGGKTSYCI